LVYCDKATNSRTKFVLNDDSDAQDDNGHGTFMAGVIAALTHNGVGMAGVTWFGQVLPVKVLDSNSAGVPRLYKAGVRARFSNEVAGRAKLETESTTPVKAWVSIGGGFIDDVADGIIFAADNGADIINLSLAVLS